MEKKRSDLAKSRFNYIKNSSIFSSKCGQVTVFIILGIILLLTLILFLVFREEIVTFKPSELLVPDKTKIENTLTACVSQLGEDALFRAGLQGGYVQVPEDISGDSSQHLRISPLNVIPYWASGPTTRIPSLSEVKAGIDKYIQTNLKKCTNDWATYKDEYDIVEKSAITSDTQLNANGVIFNVHWDLEVKDKSGELILSVSDHIAESNIKFKRMYDAATLIVQKEMKELKLEDITQDLIALEHPNLPISGIELSCTKKKWKVNEVEDTLKDMLRINLRELQIKNTDIIEYPPELTYYQNHYLWNLGEDYNQPEISVQFAFENDYPFVFEVSPRSGNYLTSGVAEMGKILSSLCFQSWKFVYNVNYPVKVMVRDETTGATFNMAFTVHLNRNIGDRSTNYKPLVSYPLGTYVTADNEGFCKSAKTPMTFYAYKLVENNYNGVFDRTPLEEVNLSYTCLEYSCALGTTEYDYLGMGDVAAYSTNVPQCIGAILKGNKDNFKEGTARVVSKILGKAEVNLTPILRIPASSIQIVEHKMLPNGLVNPIGKPVTEGIVMVELSYDPKNYTLVTPSFGYASTHFHESRVTLSEELDDSLLSSQWLELLAEADFNYELQVLVMQGDTEETAGNILAGYKGNWNLLWSEAQNGKTVTFHVLVNEKDDEEGMFEFMSELEKNSLKLPVSEIS